MKWKKSDTEIVLAALVGFLVYGGAIALSGIFFRNDFALTWLCIICVGGILFPFFLFSHLVERMDKKRSGSTQTESADDPGILQKIEEAVESNEPPEVIKEQIQWLMKNRKAS